MSDRTGTTWRRVCRRVTAALVVAFGIGTAAGAGHAQTPVSDVEVILAIDTSESMVDAIDETRRAAGAFVDALPADVPIGVETFSDDVVVLTPPTLDRDVIRAQVAGIVAEGDTALYDAVITAGETFTPGVTNRVIVVLSDGRDEGSTRTLGDAVAAVDGIQVEAISLTTELTDLESLAALGTVTPSDDVEGLTAAFGRIADLLVETIAPTTTTTPPPATTVAPSTTVAVAAPPTTVVEREPVPDVLTSSGAAIAAADPGTTPWLWIGGAGLFVGLFLLVSLFTTRDRVSRERLGIDRPRRVSDFGVRTTSAIDDALERYGKRTDLGVSLATADIKTAPAEFVATVLGIAFVAGVLGFLVAGLLLAVVLFLAVVLGARLHVRRSITKRREAFAEQLPDVLQLVTTALRSGYGISQAIESVAEEAEEPARSEFSRVLVESRLGRDLSASMHALADRMDSKDMTWIVSAIDINRETGGNLSEILHTVGGTIRERERIARQVRTLTAEGRLSARLLTALPFLIVLWQWRTNPTNFELLTHGIGLIALFVAGILMLLGSLWVNRLVNSVKL